MKLSYVLWSSFLFSTCAFSLPPGFIYLHEVDPSIQEEMRYAGEHNFIGRPIKGYEKKVCILTKETANQLAKIQRELKRENLSLKVYDCYRPVRAVKDFIAWSLKPLQQEMKAEFYPRINKRDIFKLGYLAEKSGHNRGSTVDLTIIPLNAKPSAPYQKGDTLYACTAPYQKRYQDNSLNMGTGYDCLDKLSHLDALGLGKEEAANRSKLQNIMAKYHFLPSKYEWWHFSLKNEPYPHTYFDFPVK